MQWRDKRVQVFKNKLLCVFVCVQLCVCVLVLWVNTHDLGAPKTQNVVKRASLSGQLFGRFVLAQIAVYYAIMRERKHEVSSWTTLIHQQEVSRSSALG